MEVPSELATLYKHWGKHSNLKPQALDFSALDYVLVDELLDFANERMSIWHKKTLGTPPPFTNDLILKNYRFCNIYRELDRQTIDIHSSLKPLENNFKLWLLNLMFNRFLCKPETFKKVGALSFDLYKNKKVYENLLDLPSPKYGSAYVFPISIIQKSKFNTREKFLTQYLPLTASNLASIIEDFEDKSVVEALGIILPAFNFNFKFHFTEILIDIAYQYPKKVNLFKQFPYGPGSLPTLKRLSSLDPTQTLTLLTNLTNQNFKFLEINKKRIALSAENWEGIACEFRKYTNLKNGVGRRRRFSISGVV